MKQKLKNKLVKLVGEYFPKGDKERGKATVMMSIFLCEVLEIIKENKK